LVHRHGRRNNSAAGQNAGLAFRRSPDGQLRELESSPYLTGGTRVRDLTYSLATFANDTPVIANRSSDAKSTDTIARPTGFDAGLVELVLPAAAIAQAAQPHGQADNITVVTIQPATLEKYATS
jgi:hypothetical protein